MRHFCLDHISYPMFTMMIVLAPTGAQEVTMSVLGQSHGRFFNISTKQYCTGFNHVYNIAQDSTFKVYCTDSLRLHHIL